MDELRMVRTMLDRPAPDDAVVAKGRERLRTETRGRRRTMPARRTLWVTGGLGLTAATAAAAVAISTTGTAGTDGNRSAGPQAGRSTTTTTLDARSILLAAATEADGQTDGTGGYWHTTTVDRSFYRVADGGYTVVQQEQHEEWTPSRPGRPQWSSGRSLGARPATAADTAAWQRAGSPATFKVTVPGKGLEPMTLSMKPGTASVYRAPLVDGDKVFWLGRNVTMKDLRALPADPQRLKASLKRWYGGHGTESSSDPMSSDLWLYTVAKGLITDMPVTPKVRGAAFRMLTGLRTVTAIGQVKDAQGRTGTAIAVTERTKQAGALQHRLIIDTAAGRALGEDLVVVKPGGFTAGFAPGSVWNSTTVVTQGWTASAPTRTAGPQRSRRPLKSPDRGATRA
ncbi:CU044_5270 family protein [Actinoallomurus rhizosphaericola]|uniref:CU044_5270 family protein n=1 Tax=Actinoallomurus rhizosphaericola TaxID=2952536 RepID=UPI0020937E5C|nr:CU044_5270 family protein [Actinoallomurus rhizosphaericola]MCO5996177.1 CU044_5270 family protein [Actinoallomurus rhizosphaericola]